MTVGLVSAGLLKFANSLGVVMGANIGTTLTSQMIAFGLTDFFGIVLVIGAVMRFVVKNERARAWGTAIMGLGFVFLGLEHIEATMAPIDLPSFGAGGFVRADDGKGDRLGVDAVTFSPAQASTRENR